MKEPLSDWKKRLRSVAWHFVSSGSGIIAKQLFVLLRS